MTPTEAIEQYQQYCEAHHIRKKESSGLLSTVGKKYVQLVGWSGKLAKYVIESKEIILDSQHET